MTEPPKPKPAATVILLRPAEPSGFEIFLTRRPESMPFLGGMYCFPGGTVRKEDRSSTMLQRCRGLSPAQARKILGAHLAPDEALGFWVAGVRELFEEAGVLLTVSEPEEGISVVSKTSNLAGQRGFAKNNLLSLLESEELCCDLSRLTYFSHWQTPSSQPMRFDTRFFLTILPEGQQAASSSAEVAHSVWLSPDRAITLCEKKELPMIFPTFAAVRTLADFETLDSLLKEYCVRKES